jgi:hypothetical protein
MKLPKLRLAKSIDDNFTAVEFSRADTISTVKAKLCEMFGLPNDETTRLWEVMSTSYYKMLESPLQTIDEANLFSRNFIAAERQTADGKWPSDEKKTFKSTYGTSARDSTYTSAYSSSISGYSYNKPSPAVTPGHTGLQNIGNTCFMNSAIQCLSNCPPLREYYLSGRYVQDINTTNPIGCEGKLAKDFAALMQEMWGPSPRSTVNPSNVKYTVSKFAPQFTGYQQHDSQELMGFLLDGLHEDCNRVKRKPYVEAKEVCVCVCVNGVKYFVPGAMKRP